MTSPFTAEKRAVVGYRVIRADRASKSIVRGALLFHGADCYGCANDDTRRMGIEHISLSLNANGLPFFTIPKEDVEPVYDTY